MGAKPLSILCEFIFVAIICIISDVYRHALLACTFCNISLSVHSCRTVSQKDAIMVQSGGAVYVSLHACVCPCVNPRPGESMQALSRDVGLRPQGCAGGAGGGLGGGVCLSAPLTAEALGSSVLDSRPLTAQGSEPLTPAQAPRVPPLPPACKAVPRLGAGATSTRTPCGCFRTVGFTLAKIWIVCFTMSSPALALTLDLSQALSLKTYDSGHLRRASATVTRDTTQGAPRQPGPPPLPNWLLKGWEGPKGGIEGAGRGGAGRGRAERAEPAHDQVWTPGLVPECA